MTAVAIPKPRDWPAGALHRHAVGTWLEDPISPSRFPPSKVVAVMVIDGQVMYDLLRHGEHNSRRVERKYVDWLKPLTAVGVRNIVQNVRRIERKRKTRSEQHPGL